MRIVYITAGAAGTICGNCLQDNALAAALKSRGHDVVLLPAYTPLLTDEQDVSDGRVVFGGINLYLQGKYKFFRSSGMLDRLLDSPRMLRWASSFAVDTDPANLGAMTQETFRGENGAYRREMDKLVEVVRAIRPEVVHLTNSMLASMAGPIKREVGVPVVCSLQGEADFLAGLREPYRSACYELLSGHAEQIDRFVAPCNDQIEAMRPILADALGQVETVRPGISMDGVRERQESSPERFVVGFLARVSEEKGLHLVADAVQILRNNHPNRQIELRVAGWRNERSTEYLKRVADSCDLEDRGYLAREEKFEFLAGLDVLSVPTTYRASKGLYVLEALAAGVPVVLPGIGAFPELVDATGGGLICEPSNSDALAASLEQLMLEPERAASLGEAGRSAVQGQFHVKRMADEALALYEGVIH